MVGFTFLDNTAGHSHLCFMRRSSAILIAILCALSSPARGQALVVWTVDHDWTIHYRTQQYGLVQTSLYGDASKAPTTICFGSSRFTVNHTIWPVAGAIIIPIVCLGWLLFHGLGSIYKPDKKPPPPNPSPPP